MAIKNQIQFRRGSSAEWVAISGGNGPVLNYGEPGFDVTNNILKIGDGSTSWINLDPIGSVSGSFDIITFNNTGDPDLSARQLAWNNSEGTLALALSDTYEMFLGGELHYRVRNNTGSTILAGTAVYATGLTPGGNNRIEIAPNVADGSIREVRFMGLMTEDCNTGVNGFTTHFGYIRHIDTRGDASANGTTNKLWASGEPSWSEGDILYVHPTVAGKLTKIEPKHSISVAIILNRHQNQGKLFVRPTSYGHLDDNHDVNTSGVSNNQYLRYDSATDYWVPTSSGIFSSLDVDSTSNINLGTTADINMDFGPESVVQITNEGTPRITILGDGSVGIGTITPSYALQVNGSFGATTKSFRIDHPSRPNYSLEYGSLESPYHGVRLTGRGKVVKGSGTVLLPSYLKDLIHDDDNINIQITNIKHGKTIYVHEIDLNNDQFTVRVDRAKSLGDLEFFWTLTGVRKDVEDLVVEREK